MSFKCNNCGTHEHITAVCSQVQGKQNRICILNNYKTDNDVAAPVLLPSISAIMHSDRDEVVLTRCIVDPGSQSSYMSSHLKSKLGLDNMVTMKFNLKTFLGSGVRKYETVMCNIHITLQCKIEAKFLVDPSFDLNYEVPGVYEMVADLKAKGYDLADSYYHALKDDKLEGFYCLIGADLIPYLQPLHTLLLPCGTVYKIGLHDGLILFGVIDRQYKSVRQVKTLENSLSCTLPEICEETSRLVNLVTHPRKTYFNPIQFAKEDSDVELDVEKLFQVESLDIKESELPIEQKNLVEQFENSITKEDNKYFVNLPLRDTVTLVPSNWKVSIATLERVQENLKKRGLLTEYGEIFKDQEQRGIIEKIQMCPEDFEQYNFIPHHLVVKTEGQITTKVCAVFNCSIKTDKVSPSLTQACFEGLDLINNLANLLLKFRQGKYVLLADIEKAFLNIFLKSDNDKDRLCFFWQKGSELIVYRYRTINFGLNCSPYVLHAVIMHHLSQYVETETVQALKDRLYVDNFVYSTSCLETLTKVYNKSREIMEQGGFNLHSWNTNSESLKDIMTRQGTLVQHNEPVEKVLGYHYSPINDTLKLSNFKLTDNTNITKRGLLSDVSKVFDPLGLTAPVRGKLLMKKIWSERIGWDQEISTESSKSWKQLHKDLNSLKQLEFPRVAIDDPTAAYTLNIMCDGSKGCYGCCAYATQEGKSSNLIFVKPKVTPPNKTIPQVELLAVFLAMKTLTLILDSFSSKPKQIFIWSDSQIVLEWLISGGNPVNKFTKNRITDVRKNEE